MSTFHLFNNKRAAYTSLSGVKGRTPNGVFGVVAAGVPAWILAKSVVGTKRMAWALLIHFLQDTTHMALFFIRRLNRL